MNLNLVGYRRVLFICVSIIVAVAVVLALGVIEPVKAEVARGATPERAVQAFWGNIGLNLLSAIALCFIAVRSKGRSWLSTSAHVVVGFVVLFLGIALADAAAAYQSHGPPMHTASRILFVCAAADFLTGALVATTAFLQPMEGKKGTLFI